ncbi:hypothetical protein LTR03_002451 [Friedmanniomyces endolithicus]|nr:hypothetical protein LTR03_002451 [Friedmanniomyces endolithicus]
MAPEPSMIFSHEPLEPASTVSRLESLPAEIRNVIYELVLVPSGGVALARRPHTDRLWMVRPRRGSHLIAVTATSKLLRREALSMFYGLNMLELTCTNGPCFHGPFIEQVKWSLPLEIKFKKDIDLLSDWLQAVSYSIDRRTRILSLVVDTPAWFAVCHDDFGTRSWQSFLSDYVERCLGAERSGRIVKSVQLANISKRE